EGVMDIVVAGTADAIMMVEGQAYEVPEAVLVDAIAMAHEEIKLIVAAQLRLQEKVGKAKRPVVAPVKDETSANSLLAYIGDRLDGALYHADKSARTD